MFNPYTPDMHCSAVVLIASKSALMCLPEDWSLKSDNIHRTWEAESIWTGLSFSSDEPKLRILATSTDTVPLVILDFRTLAKSSQ